MFQIDTPQVILPPVYELPFRLRRWCKLSEVCTAATKLSQAAETNFNPTPEELVSCFAALVRPNRLRDHLGEQKKIFRYSQDGKGFQGTYVSVNKPGTFRLEIEGPYPEELFVPEEWAAETLRAVQAGAVAAADFGGTRIGFSPPSSKRGSFLLGD